MDLSSWDRPGELGHVANGEAKDTVANQASIRQAILWGAGGLIALLTLLKPLAPQASRPLNSSKSEAS